LEGISRRKLLKMAAVGAAAIPLESRSLMAGATTQEPTVLVPADKGLTKSWLEGLTKRGKPTVVRGKALANIGMPVGGIGCGQVYLSGDGRLWHWDIFNQFSESDMGDIRNGTHYKTPMKPESPFGIGFFVSMKDAGETRYWNLDSNGFESVQFTGRYPVGQIDYSTAGCPLHVTLNAFSPFIPLDADSSSLPLTLMIFSLKNSTAKAVKVAIGGWMENPVGKVSRQTRALELRTTLAHAGFEHAAIDVPTPEKVRPDVLFADFESETYGNWTVEGTAFGSGPVEIAKIPKYQGDVHGKGRRVVNSHNVRQGEDVGGGDSHIGKLTSPEFPIHRRFIAMLIGGGSHVGKTCVNLTIDGIVVRTATGRDNNEMSPVIWDAGEFDGRKARIEIVDSERGAWGNIGVDQIVFTDQPAMNSGAFHEEADFGTIGMAIAGGSSDQDARARLGSPSSPGKSAATVEQSLVIKPGETRTIRFMVAWHFPNVARQRLGNLEGGKTLKRHYGKRFKSANDVLHYAEANLARLENDTREWVETWYDSTLPYWFLDRTMANASTLATSTCYRFDNGRFYGWEGVYCCPGTCTHVWHYAHAVARLFPELESDTRERVDYGIGYHEDGHLGHRAEFWQDAATDGQCGTILRVYREHQMRADRAWLKRLWPKVKKSIQFLIVQDPNRDGVLEGAQFNTLDATWYGKIAWISSLYVAALRAGEAMASELGDAGFAQECATIAQKGSARIVEDLFNGEYFIQRTDPRFPKAINTNDGCHIDQVFGQSWGFQVGLPRVLPIAETRKALQSLFRYSFAPDVGAYRAKSKIKGGRWYALPKEAGLLMCTWPRGGIEEAPGKGNEDWAVGYFNECMTGFEHQVAGHMINEGLVTEGLTIERTIHERYSAERRNPYNEIECSDHYARAMASYGVYLAACGFRYHGPNKSIAFHPRWGTKDFRCAFTSAEGWGTFHQTQKGQRMEVKLEVKHGTTAVKTLSLTCPQGWKSVSVKGTSAVGNVVVKLVGEEMTLVFAKAQVIGIGKPLQVIVTEV